MPAANESVLGEVEDFFGHIGVIALTLKVPLVLGDTIHVRGHTTDLTQKVLSMQINRKPIQKAKKGDPVGIKVDDKCRKGDAVFRVNE
ncbi:MAG: translation elongation factor-like protein [Elusimicrobia bacterium]|nr:translation elongation factor-like protein [Elusimicrobiota bacterium]